MKTLWFCFFICSCNEVSIVVLSGRVQPPCATRGKKTLFVLLPTKFISLDSRENKAMPGIYEKYSEVKKTPLNQNWNNSFSLTRPQLTDTVKIHHRQFPPKRRRINPAPFTHAKHLQRMPSVSGPAPAPVYLLFPSCCIPSLFLCGLAMAGIAHRKGMAAWARLGGAPDASPPPPPKW